MSRSIRWLRRARVATTLLALVAGFVTTACDPPPPGTLGRDVVVFDIDGTLTADELSTAVQPDAVNAVETYVDKGYTVVYLTARWQPLQESQTRDWLASNGFPSLPLYMSSNLLLTEDSRIDFKTSTLAQIEEGTPEVVGAYGDSSSDFAAYANAGVDAARVFALKRASASACQAGTYASCLTSGYTSHLPFIEALPAGQ